MCYYLGRTRQACELRERALAEPTIEKETVGETARDDQGRKETATPGPAPKAAA